MSYLNMLQQLILNFLKIFFLNLGSNKHSGTVGSLQTCEVYIKVSETDQLVSYIGDGMENKTFHF